MYSISIQTHRPNPHLETLFEFLQNIDNKGYFIESNYYDYHWNENSTLVKTLKNTDFRTYEEGETQLDEGLGCVQRHAQNFSEDIDKETGIELGWKLYIYKKQKTK